MKTFSIVLLALCFAVTGCKNNATDSDNTALITDYLPLKVGNAWTYATSTVTTSGVSSSASSSVLSVVQTNTLIGGQPNAFVLQAVSNRSQQINIACCTDAKTLYVYLGETDLFAVPNILYWYSSGVNNATVAPGQSKKYAVVDSAYHGVPFSVKRSPGASIASVSLVGNDTLQINGVAAGSTSLVLQKTGGTVQDTMVVLIEVKNGGRTIAPPFASWMPVWLVTGSTAETMYSWDTLYSFRLRKDSSLCTDNISYGATSQYIGLETISALGTTLQTEKFITNISVTERIMYKGSLVFDGPSTSYVITLWLVKGVGIVKGTFSGNSLASGIVLEGTYDSAGVLHGFFISPRVAYGSVETTSGPYEDYFNVNTSMLTDPASSNVAVMTAKNF
jgi:hypothetical protein